MGTNYYHHGKVCDHCGRGDAPRHIGKSSGGWCFSLHVYPNDGIKDLPDWEKLFGKRGTLIKDEYGRVIPAREMKEIIRDRSWKPKDSMGLFNVPPAYKSWEEFHEKNYSEFGPRGLVRYKVGEAARCIGHGRGTWDLVVGEFS